MQNNKYNLTIEIANKLILIKYNLNNKMASKGSSITLTADEILKIKMKANLIPNCT